jgi:hypothetical protein
VDSFPEVSPRKLYMYLSSHYTTHMISWFDYTNNMWWKVQLIELLVMQFFSFRQHRWNFIHIRRKGLVFTVLIFAKNVLNSFKWRRFILCLTQIAQKKCGNDGYTPVFLNRRAAARCRALASIIPGRERPEETTICYKISLVQLITNLNVILYLSTCHIVHISVLILFMIMP